jgi:pimeloyl-ACP methyl ester carboxylesterase
MYDAEGSPDAPPIVFVHGIGMTRAQWLPQVRDLSDSYRTVAMDLPGHGALATTKFSLRSAVEQLGTVIDEAGGGRALIAGVSLGGFVAMEYAAAHAAGVAGLILTGCSANPRGVLSVIPPTLALFTRAMGQRWLTFVNQVNFRVRYGDELAKQQLEAGFFFKATQDALWQLRGRDFRRKLSGYPGPTLILNGERDVMYRIQELNFLASAQDARLQLVRGAGHVANLEEPDAYNRAVRRFARSVDW